MKQISRFVPFAYVAKMELWMRGLVGSEVFGQQIQYKDGRDTLPIHFDFIIYVVVGFPFRIVVWTL